MPGDQRYLTATRVAHDLVAEDDARLLDGALGGLVARYSLIHVPPPDVPAVLAELARVLMTGGQLLLALQIGDDCRHLEQAYGHAVSLDAYRMQPDRLTAQLADVGLDVHARVVREPEAPETVPQAYLLARRRPPCSAA